MGKAKTAGCEMVRIEAGWLFERGICEGVRLDARAGGMVLGDWGLVEDDADGAGYPYGQDVLRGKGKEGVRIKKELVLDTAEVLEARVLIYHTVEELWKSEAYEAKVRVAVNGRGREATLKTGWNEIAVEAGELVPGVNEVVVWTEKGRKGAIVPISDRGEIVGNLPWRAGVGQRSFKSRDGGKTWSTGLGEGDDEAGEYLIRLHVMKYGARGVYTSGVMDLLDVERRQAIKRLAEVEEIAAKVRGETPRGTGMECWVRTGATPVFDETAWEGWRRSGEGQRWAPRGRYFQVRLELSTDDPRRTPVVKGLQVEVVARKPPTDGGVGQVRVEVFDARPIVRSSLKFEYEQLDHPRLKELREKYRLDEVVAGAKSQWEYAIRLNHWVSCQWKWHAPVDYPRWDALEILEKQAGAEGGESRGGFCGHYAIVLVQCLMAMGMQARFVFGDLPGVIGGHEVVEFWSDDFGKWILLDPNMDRFYLGRGSTPMNALDIHRAILRHYFGEGAIGTAAENLAKFEAKGLEGFLAKGPFTVFGGNAAGPEWFDPRKAHLMWGVVRMMPGNAFFSRRRPMPKSHGYGLGWVWNRYWHWFDGQTPRERRFSGYTDREGDFYWSVNEVDLFLEEGEERGVLWVTAETFTPGLETLLVSVDEGAWEGTGAEIVWRLHEGVNTLKVRTRNVAGVEGRVSAVRVVVGE